MAEFPSETFVSESIQRYLQRLNYPAIIKEFETEGGRIDLLAYKWRDGGYGIEYFVVECKDSGDLKVKQFVDIIQEQVSRYQASYPKVHLAIPKPEDVELEEDLYISLCKSHGIGLLSVSREGEVEERVSPGKPAPDEVQARMGRIDSFTSAILGFIEVFRDQPKRGPSSTWVSTAGALQHNLWYDGASIRFAVNAEDAKDLKVGISSSLLRELSSNVPEPVGILVRKEKYPLPRQRDYFVVMEKPFRTISSEDIEHIVNLVNASKGSGYNIHLNFWVPLWKSGELFGRSEVLQRITQAKESLGKIFESLS